MLDWWDESALVAATLVVALIPVLWIIVRRRWLSARGWVFDCSLAIPSTTPSTRWMLGVARINGDRFEWYRVYSWSLRPRVAFSRSDNQVLTTRQSEEDESAALYDQERVSTVDGPRGRTDLAMSPRDMTAFLSWMEASPPGQNYSS